MIGSSAAFHWCFVGMASIGNCVGTLLLKYSRQSASPGLIGLLFSPWFIGGLFAYAVSVVLFGYALDVLPVSRAYPVLAGLGFALLSIVASFLLGETLTVWNITGMCCVIVGIVLLAW